MNNESVGVLTILENDKLDKHIVTKLSIKKNNNNLTCCQHKNPYNLQKINLLINILRRLMRYFLNCLFKPFMIK